MSLDYLSDRQHEALRALESFEVAEWCFWIRCLIDEGVCRPDLAMDRTPPHRLLIWLYEEGLKSTAAFVKALGAVYEGSTRARERQLFYLLQAISVVKPETCKDLLFQHLKARRFDGVVFEAIDLKTLALLARSNYGPNDPSFLGFVERSAWESHDFGYRLAAFRIWAKHDAARAFELFELLLPHLESEDRQKILGGTLRAVCRAESYQPLYDWYVSELRRALMTKSPDGYPNLERTLAEHVVPWLPSELPEDPYAWLLAAQLAAGHWPFVAEELALIASKVDHWLLRERPAEVLRTLEIIWDATERRIGDWAEVPAYGVGVRLPWLVFGDSEFVDLPAKLFILNTFFRTEVLRKSDRKFDKQEMTIKGNESCAMVLERASRSVPSRTLPVSTSRELLEAPLASSSPDGAWSDLERDFLRISEKKGRDSPIKEGV